jgi:putative transposase
MNDHEFKHDAQMKYSYDEISRLPGEFRIVQPGGIEFRSLRYQSPDLSVLRFYLQSSPNKKQRKSSAKQDELRKEKVQIKYDPMDLSTLYVYDVRPDHEDWLSVPAVNQDYTKGLSIDEHNIIRSYILRQKREVDTGELATAKKHIRGIVERQFGLATKGYIQKKVARYHGVRAESTPGAVSDVLASTQPKNEPTLGEAKKE